MAVELEEALELGFLVCMRFALAKYIVEQFRYWPSNRRYKFVELSASQYMPRPIMHGIPKMYIIASTTGAHAAPMDNPYRTLTACGIILQTWLTE